MHLDPQSAQRIDMDGADEAGTDHRRPDLASRRCSHQTSID
jgi:hypothetical protein